MTPIVEVRDLRVSFGGKEVVHGVDFTVGAGERLALVGESGSGKTVTALSLLGLNLNAAVTGSALFHGRAGQPPRDLLKMNERELLGVRGREIAMIFQEPMTALNPLYTVGDQIAEVLQFKEGLAKREAWTGAVQALRETGIPEPEQRAFAYPHQLSGGQRQRAMIAMALAGKPQLLLADEPTTALDMSLRGQILALLADLQSRNGMSMLIITHDLNLVRRFANRVAVLEDGHLVEQGSVDEVFSQPRHPYTRKLIDSRPERAVDEAPMASGAGQVMVARDLQVGYPVRLSGFKGWFRKGRFVAVKGASFVIAPGRTLGVVGESGSGKTTLALAALGLVPHEGELDVVGRRWGPRAGANKAIRRVVQVVFQDPFSSLSPRMVIEEIVGEGLQVHEPGLDAEQRRQRVVEALEDVGLTDEQFPGLLHRYPHEFSGGQRQRLAIARALIVRPQLLVLDEPTSALDVTIQKQVLNLLQRLQREHGLSYLLITHDLDVIRAMAHDVVVMKDGEVVEEGEAEALFAMPRNSYTKDLLAAASVEPD
jgi:microcin C transport system ATP-binding protein